MKYAQDAAAWNLLHPRKMFWALSYASISCWWYFFARSGKVMPETHWIHRPDARILQTQHQRGVAVQLMEDRSKIEEVTHTLCIRAGHTYFLGLHIDLFVRSHLPKVTLRTWFLGADIVCPTPRQKILPGYFLPSFEMFQSLHTGRVWSGLLALSLGNDCHPRGDKRMSQIPAIFPKIPFAVYYCSLFCRLSSESVSRKAAGEVQKRRRAH